MAKYNITASGASTPFIGSSPKVLVQVNGALTGNIIVADGTTTVATITNPTVGSQYEYWNFGTSVVITPSALCDITVNVSSGR